ncbi:hypothetical protein A3K63_00585 [Candidatus Micrarchaeota archaeon RBG_16_49_10]|nr:MAG: hypothetical protein A3K63_00585 [Candidatus Micrarchaeota archaeon RBG_16_49_10]
MFLINITINAETIKMIYIFVDRDGTLNRDLGYYGGDDNWADNLEFHGGVIDGLRLLGGRDEIKIHIASNQSGVAIGYFSEGRAREITEYIMKITREAGGRIDGYELSFHVPLFGYVIRRALEGRLSLSNVDWKYVKLRTPRRKPDIGMMKNVVEADGNKIGNSVIYMIGDLKQDIEMGINAGGKSVLVLNGSNDKEKGKVEKLMNKPKLKGRIQIVENFLEAAKWILDDLYS